MFGKTRNVVSLIAAAAFAAAIIPALAQDPPVTVRAVKVAKAIVATKFDDPIWQKVPVKEIALSTAFAAHPAITGDARISRVRVQAARTAKGIAFRLQWRDDQANTDLTSNRFADAVALQFPLSRSTETLAFMGGEGKRVNIWYWNAAKNAAENLIADGFGTVTKLATQDVTAHGKYANGTWTVVFVRSFRTIEPEAVALSPQPGSYPIAIAVWEGRNQERDGFKAVTLEWQRLQM